MTATSQAGPGTGLTATGQGVGLLLLVAVLLTFLSLGPPQVTDDLTSLHERLEGLGRSLGGGDGLTSVGYLLLSPVEELLETVAAVTLLVAALSAVHFHSDHGRVRLAYRAARRPTGSAPTSHAGPDSPGDAWSDRASRGRSGGMPGDADGDSPRLAAGA